MMDEVIITETPPLYNAYSPIGEQKEVLITGNRTKRILHGAMNIRTGDVQLFITKEFDGASHQEFLKLINQHWKGWKIVLFEDRATQHKANSSIRLAKKLKIEIRFLPTATPKLNAMDHLWKFVKKDTQANRARLRIDESVDFACEYIIKMKPKERLKKAGTLSKKYWLKP